VRDGVPPWRHLAVCNAVTYLSLTAGVAALGCAAAGRLHLMAASWCVAVLADNLDGRFASRFDRTEQARLFGRELDSLVDVVSFGAVPVACFLLLAPPPAPLGVAGFLAPALLYLTAMVTRLGAHNVAGPGGCPGLPSTEAALVLATVLLVPGAAAYAGWVLLPLAVLMLLPVHPPRPRGLVLVALVAWVLGVTGAHLWLALGPKA